MNILLIRLRLIGDVVFTTPIPRALKRNFPGARISYLVEDSAAPVLAHNPHIDDLIIVHRSRGWRRLVADMKLAARVRGARYDVVLDLHGGPRSSWLTLASGARQRIGYDVQGRSWMYTRTVSRPRQLRARHSVVNQWDLLEAIDGWAGATPDPSRDAVEMSADPAAGADRRGAPGQERHRELARADRRPRQCRQPVQAMARASLYQDAHRTRSRLVPTPDRHQFRAFRPRGCARGLPPQTRHALGAAGDRIVDFGEFGLAELRALIARSRLFIGGDTGPLHIAATTATPIVGLYGPTLPARSAPWRDPAIPTESLEVAGLPCRPCEQRVCAPGDFRCLTTLHPEDVISAAERALRWSA